MASKQDILAGGAYVKLWVDNSALVKGLKSAGKQLQSFGAGIAKIGGTFMAAGSAVLGPLGAMVAGFASAGSAVADMAARTGMGAEGISALGYAAGMTGANVEDVEKGVRKMQQQIADAATGSATATKALGALGVTVADLAGLSPEQQMARLADGIAQISDPAQRTAAAMDIFGKSGTSLLPMLSGGSAGLAAFADEAARLGMIMSSEDAAAADALGDAMDRVQGSLKGAAMQIGAALAPAVIKLADVIAGVVSGVVEFVRNNRQLVVTVAAVAAGVFAAGGALVGIGGAIAVIGFALSGIATGISAIGAVVGAILSPIGLLVVGLAAGIYAFVKFTSAGQQLATWLGGKFATLLESVRGVIGGISDAFAAGDMTLAANLAWTGVQLAFYSARDAILAGYEDLKSAGVVAWTSIKLAFVQVTNFIADVWDTFATGITSVFDGVVVNIRQAWNSVISWIASQILKLWGVIEPVLNSLGLLSEQTDIGGAVKIVQEDNQRFARKLDTDKAKRDEQRGAGMAQRDRGRADALASAERERQAALDAFTAAGKAGESPQVAAARAELDRLRKEAAVAAEAARAKQAGETGGVAGGEGPGLQIADRGGAATTFSAAALQALGQGAGPMDRLLKVNEEQKAIAKQQLAAASAMVASVAGLGTFLTLTP